MSTRSLTTTRAGVPATASTAAVDEPGQLPVVQTRFADVNDVDAGRRRVPDETEQAVGARRDDPAPIGDEADERA